MQNKLQELTEKIYQEGVEKANKEAEQILADAKQKADALLAEAQKKSEAVLEKASKESEELKTNALNELQLSARQAISDLKQQVTELIQVKTIEPETTGAFKEAEFTGKIIELIIGKWDPNGSDNVDLTVLLPTDKQKEFESYFKARAGAQLQKGLEVKFSDKIKGGFKIGPKDGGYMVSLTDEDFNQFFKIYLRPRLIELLFDKKTAQK